jgi:tetratricopeptide (TPR) repeat protein
MSVDPAELETLEEQALQHLRAGRGPAALAVCCRVLEQDIGAAPAYHLAGLALELMGDDTAALASYGHAIALNPGAAAPFGAMALLSLGMRDEAGAQACAHKALELDPAEPAASLTLARLEIQHGKAQDAVARLISRRPLTAPTQEAMAHRALGDALDAMGRPGEAFAEYATSAAVFRRQFAAACAGPQPLAGLDLCRALAYGYRGADDDLWRPVAAGEDGGAAGHVFVVGFPRSGTTLLEQVLAGHPNVVALEEQATLTPAIDAYLDPSQGIGALADMDEATAEHWRQDYWRRVRGCGVDPADKVFIDKQPFYTLWLPLIGKLFPDARIIVVRRDPRDVVFSCFRRPFRMTPVTYELMDLERGAALYAEAMDILQTFIERSASPYLIYRHEDLVADFDITARSLCGFLGLEWRESMRDFAATAARRDIRTPSAHQVTRGLNRDGIGAWRAYAGPMAPVLPILTRLAETYGYEAA